MTERFDDKIAVVSGGGAGIGEATCLRLAAEGADVAVVDWNRDAAMEVSERIADEHDQDTLALVADVGNEDEVKRAAAEINDVFGRVDVLVNNAAIRVEPTPVTETSEESWDRILDVNLKGVAFVSKHIVPLMAAGGAIVNIASVGAINGRSGWSQYDATKGAVISMTRDMACDHAENGIRVNAVSPGWTITDYHIGRQDSGDPEDFVRSMTTPRDGGPGILCRAAKPEEIADPIVFLASSEASFITGENLVVDGGVTVI